MKINNHPSIQLRSFAGRRINNPKTRAIMGIIINIKKIRAKYIFRETLAIIDTMR
jgi:hypothetical protein